MSKRAMAIVASAALAAGLAAQNPSDLRIGEILVENTSGLVDEFGKRSGWIEVYNNSDGTVKFGGCYLTDDKSDLRKYRIPVRDASTNLKPRQSVVFFASGDAARGTYHTSFTLERGETICIVSNDGKTIIDELEIPVDLEADKSVMRVPGGIKGTDFETVPGAAPTPGGYNGDVEAKSKSDVMREKDPTGLVLTVISVGIVFIALFALSIIFTRIGSLQSRASSPGRTRRGKRKGGDGGPSPEAAAAVALALSLERGAETQAAIALALHLHLCGEAHDQESFVLTLRPSQGGGWSDKSQGLRQPPRR